MTPSVQRRDSYRYEYITTDSTDPMFPILARMFPVRAPPEARRRANQSRPAANGLAETVHSAEVRHRGGGGQPVCPFVATGRCSVRAGRGRPSSCGHHFIGHRGRARTPRSCLPTTTGHTRDFCCCGAVRGCRRRMPLTWPAETPPLGKCQVLSQNDVMWPMMTCSVL